MNPQPELLLAFGHTDSIRNIAFLPDSLHLVSAGCDGTVKVWNTTNGRLERTLFDEEEQAYCLAVSRDRAIVACSFLDSERIVLVDAQSGERISTLDGQAVQLSFSPDGSMLAAGPPIVVWDLRSGDRLRRS